MLELLLILHSTQLPKILEELWKSYITSILYILLPVAGFKVAEGLKNHLLGSVKLNTDETGPSRQLHLQS